MIDIVTLIATLEFLEDSGKALREAARVSRRKIFLGVLNLFSLVGIVRKIKGIFEDTLYNNAKFYTLLGLKDLISCNLPDISSIMWAGALTFFLERLDNILTFRQNPFGSFLGVSINLC